jgi:transcriptional regulator with XRE-family HTH domain
MKCFDCKKLRNIRLLKKYSLEMTARLMKIRTGVQVSKSAICNWEQAKAKPSIENLTAISELFEVPIDYFFTYDTNKLLVNDKKYDNKYYGNAKMQKKDVNIADGAR